jgi:Trypsin-like peptidase domain
MASKIQPPREAIQGYVLPLALMRETDAGWWPEAIVGTGFLVAEGRGLGVTAAHVAKVVENHPTAAGVALFVQVSGKWEAMPILKLDRHPVEDVALFRIADDDYYSPFTLAADQHYASAPYELWGYPEDVHYDRMADLGALAPDLVYSAGHIRRQINHQVPTIFGRSFYELSTPAGRCCSGAPVAVVRDPHPANHWRAVGVYAGERRNEANTFAVGYATRTEAIAEHWPRLIEARGSDLSALCAL